MPGIFYEDASRSGQLPLRGSVWECVGCDAWREPAWATPLSRGDACCVESACCAAGEKQCRAKACGRIDSLSPPSGSLWRPISAALRFLDAARSREDRSVYGLRARVSCRRVFLRSPLSLSIQGPTSRSVPRLRRPSRSRGGRRDGRFRGGIRARCRRGRGGGRACWLWGSR
jgi:hypothetical protein